MSASQLALLGGETIGAPPADRHPNFREETYDRVLEIMRAGGTVGLNKTTPIIGEAERAIAEWQGVPHCLLASSGHAALHDCVIGLEVSWGDEVIATPFTWGASVSCILHNNAIPVFVDVCPETGLMDPAQIEAAITPRTKAILPVHIFGQAANMTAIREIADRNGLVVIEDGSQAHGSIHAGRKVGTFGDAAGFSCMGGKLLASAEAGYMVTPHEDVYWKASLCAQHMGRSSEPGFPHERFGGYVDSLVYTYRLSPLIAVMLAEQVKKIDAENAGRRESVRLFRQRMAGVRIVRFPEYPEGDDPVYHMLTMNFDAGFAGVSKQTFFSAMQAEGIGCFQYIPSPITTWRRLHWQTYDGPKVMWAEPLRQSGIDYREVRVPNCERKIAQSVEMGWNYIEPSEEKMARLASAFAKVEENLPALREWEAEQARS
ncbi:MAG: DegT/DnrJ/EryC1/StrS family aminotransferase [Armatimonadetes bacterium]|nr:DegT/DnrJ/EryC1/StrS family aminotransferase [Armatimonadota bacterium]